MDGTVYKFLRNSVTTALVLTVQGFLLLTCWAGSSNSPFVLDNRSTGRDKHYPWLAAGSYERLDKRIPPPRGFRRVSVRKGSFAAWLRRLPLKPGRPKVMLHNGSPKGNQSAHHSVVLIDVGARDLQQCADAIIRLRCEYLRVVGCQQGIAFRFTSGHLAEWKKWRVGFRPQVKGNRVSWSRVAKSNGGYVNFRKYLKTVFTYAGTASLSKELKTVKNPSSVEIGDVFIRGGFPGHAVLVVDVAQNQSGDRVFLLAQSFMPAQEIHILRNQGSRIDPWYRAASSGSLHTPEWVFRYTDLKRFKKPQCAARSGKNETGFPNFCAVEVPDPMDLYQSRVSEYSVDSIVLWQWLSSLPLGES